MEVRRTRYGKRTSVKVLEASVTPYCAGGVGGADRIQISYFDGVNPERITFDLTLDELRTVENMIAIRRAAMESNVEKARRYLKVNPELVGG